MFHEEWQSNGVATIESSLLWNQRLGHWDPKERWGIVGEIAVWGRGGGVRQRSIELPWCLDDARSLAGCQTQRQALKRGWCL
jgi:hypothetical protein